VFICTEKSAINVQTRLDGLIDWLSMV